MKLNSLLAVVLVLPLLAVPADAAGSRRAPAELPAVEAVAVPEAVAMQLDGDLTEAIWDRAEPITAFVQRDPLEGGAPTFRTRARVAYDRTALYVAVEAFDPDPSRLIGLLTRRDTESPSDWIRVAVDSYHDRRSAYEFAVNPAGVKQDRYWFNDGRHDTGWDAVWDVVVSRNAAGWRAEFRIPFSQLRFQPRAASTFGFAVTRQIGRLNETSTWPLLPKSASGYVSSFGTLRGLSSDLTSRRLELTPYSVAQLKTRPPAAGDPLARPRDPDASLGLDLKYALTPGMTLTATANPDFGQVEADPAVVNLTAFETFFSERRPFFVEGSGIFRFDTDCSDDVCTGLFYSRRIGRSPQGSVSLADGAYASSPAQTTILGAAKVTGKLAGFSFGALNAVTAREAATVADGDARSRVPIEPATNFTVVRARRELANQSSVGFIATATARGLPENLRMLAGQAYTGGVDADWRLGSKYSLTGYWAGSSVHGAAEAIDRLQRSNVHSFQRPDAAHVSYDPGRTALRGHAGAFAVNKIGGERVRFSSHVGYKSPGFDVNDVGFLRRADVISMSNWLQHRFDRPSRYFRSFRYNLNGWAGYNLGGDRLHTGFNVNAHAVFRNNWSAGSGVNVNLAGLDDRGTRGGPAVRANGRGSVWFYANTDSRRLVSANLFGFVSDDRRGTHGWSLGPAITLRPTPALLVSVGVSVERNEDRQQYVATVADGGTRTRYLFGALDQTTVSLTSRVNYTITPTLSVQLYAQPFVSAGEYATFTELADGRARRYEDRYSPLQYAGNPDFNYRSFRTTNVLRWEYRAGSTLFVVWQQGREDVAARGDFRFGRDFGDLFAAPGSNVFLVKLAYWLNR